ncbi:1,4-dihydroxy-2-naphthoate octaprenyltransferase [Prevotella sp. E15-22]|uniref:1,4-dihydroxy-2-naphthoate octaprenyltransferase n=1 Tax=Prevotella sp. E15-22 TaxID=2937774 RepID=UPI0020680555|nr:1,4-dihydroxy-2-naphthoate octaprenyltransferase [Prevotella sp. E15-22]UPS45636.1 1,4-dihydroxy-2-naphthoate octaprenyltransferase [Prevotella sp. E15-22]
MEVKKNSFKAWVLAARPKTLTGAAVPVMIGLSLAWKDSINYIGHPFSWTAAVLCILFAFIMQIDANFINDFVDYIKGTDDRETRLGPERACTQGWVSIEAMKHAIATTTVLACIVGLPLALYGGLEMILIGLLCVIFCFLYTTHLSYIGLGDVLVLIFFGLIPVSMTYYVQLHTLTFEVFMAAIACGIVIDTLLLVNNFRDRDTDKLAGKHTLVVRIGEKYTLGLYWIIGIAAFMMGLSFGLNGKWWAFILPMLYTILHTLTFLKIKHIWKGRELNKCLSETARNILIYGLLVSIGLLLN